MFFGQQLGCNMVQSSVQSTSVVAVLASAFVAKKKSILAVRTPKRQKTKRLLLQSINHQWSI
jgi:hypothetical protein